MHKVIYLRNTLAKTFLLSNPYKKFFPPIEEKIFLAIRSEFGKKNVLASVFRKYTIILTLHMTYILYSIFAQNEYERCYILVQST